MKLEILEVLDTGMNKLVSLNEVLDSLEENIRLFLCKDAAMGVDGERMQRVMFGLDDEGNLILMDWGGNYFYAPDRFVVNKIQFSFEDGPIMVMNMNDRMLVWGKRNE